MMDKYLDRIPAEWHGFFAILLGDCPSVTSLNEWWQEAAASHYGEMTSLNKLCTLLLCEEPHITKDQLTFIPRLLLLSIQQQQILLAFLDNHKNSLTKDVIYSVCQCLESVHDSWITFLIKRIRKDKLMDNREEYSVSERNMSDLDALVTSLKDDSDEVSLCGSVWKSMAACNMKMADVEDPEFHSSQMASQPIPMDVDTPQGKFFVHSPQGSQHSTPNSVKRKIAVDDVPLAEKFASQSSGDASFGNIASSQISGSELERLSRQLADWWEGREDILDDVSEMEVLTKVTVSQMGLLCKDFSTLSESGLIAACKHMNKVSSHLPYSHAVCFAEMALQPKLMELKLTCSRSLQRCFVTFSKSFGRPTIEGVVLPALRNEGFCTSKADLINKVVKEGLDATLKEELLKYAQNSQIENISVAMLIDDVKQIADHCLQLCEPVLLVLQTLLDSKLTLKEQSLTSFIKCMENNSSVFKSNLKFGKLVLALINKYPKQLLPVHHPSLQVIVMNHTTFLKKSLSAALSRMCT